MHIGRVEEISAILDELGSSIEEIEGCAVVSIEGLPIASALPEGIDDTKIAAMTAAMLSLGERAVLEIGKGSLQRVFTEGDNGFLIAINAGPNAVLTVIASVEAKLGLLFLDIRRAAERIAMLI